MAFLNTQQQYIICTHGLVLIRLVVRGDKWPVAHRIQIEQVKMAVELFNQVGLLIFKGVLLLFHRVQVTDNGLKSTHISLEAFNPLSEGEKLLHLCRGEENENQSHKQSIHYTGSLFNSNLMDKEAWVKSLDLYTPLADSHGTILSSHTPSKTCPEQDMYSLPGNGGVPLGRTSSVTSSLGILCTFSR